MHVAATPRYFFPSFFFTSKYEQWLKVYRKRFGLHFSIRVQSDSGPWVRCLRQQTFGEEPTLRSNAPFSYGVKQNSKMWTDVFKHAPSKRRRMFEKELNTVASLCSLFMYRWDPQKGNSNSTVLAGQWRSVAPERWKNPPPNRNIPEKRPEQSTTSYSYLCGTLSLLQHTCNISQIYSGDFRASPSSDESAEIIKRVAGQGRIQMPNLHHGNWEWNIYI